MYDANAQLQTVLESAFALIEAAAGQVIAEAPQQLREAALETRTYHERSQFTAAHHHLLQVKDVMLRHFSEALRSRVASDMSSTPATPQGMQLRGETDWADIGLIDEEAISEDIAFSRIGQYISHACDAELREQSSYMSALLGHGKPEPDRNPLRGAVVGWAMHSAIEAVTPESDLARLLAGHLGQNLSQAMKACYRGILTELKRLGVRKADLVVRNVETPRSATVPASRYAEDPVQHWERSLTGRLVADAGDGVPRWEPRVVPTPNGPPAEAGAAPSANAGLPETAASVLDQLIRGKPPAALRPLPGTPGGTTEPDEGRMADLVRRLARSAAAAEPTAPGSFDTAPMPAELPGQPATPVNLIRNHRAELEEAAEGKLDHLVIEIVGDLFDAIFADDQVKPEIARLLARLQLPVLRVAMKDPAFFASRRHPVRRFVNRIASLGAALEDLDSTAGREWLSRVDELVLQIVEGRFEQIAAYEETLLELERFTAEQARAEIKASPAAPTIRQKETEWRRLSRFSDDMRQALQSLQLEPYLRDFLSQPWCQAIVASLNTDGSEANRTTSLRGTGLQLALSVLPKRTLEDRKRFISSLPGLMASLNQGLDDIGWDEARRDAFFGELIAAHAGSLKARPWSDLDHNLHVRRLELVFRIPVPSGEEARAGASPPPLRAPMIEQRFSAEEAEQVGLIDEAQVDWARPMAPATTPAAQGADDAAEPVLAEAVDGSSGDAPGDPTEARETLRDRLQVGLSYSLLLDEQWEKVRLTYMSPGRNFFMFTHGSKDRRSISMTARTLDRLAEGRRLRAFETAPLLDRATARVRSQVRSQQGVTHNPGSVGASALGASAH